MAPTQNNAVNVEASKCCKKCKNTAISGLKCIQCGAVSHPSCVKLLKNSVKIIDDKQIDCCLTSDSQGKNLTNDNGDVQENCVIPISQYMCLKDLLVEKDKVLDQQQKTISSLYEQIRLLNQLNKSFVHTSSNKHHRKTERTNPDVSNVAYSYVLSQRPQGCKIDKANLNSRQNNQRNKNAEIVNKTSNDKSDGNNAALFTNTEVSSAILQAQTKTKCDEIISLGDDTFIKVSHKRRRAYGKPVIGENPNLNLKAVQKKIPLFVSRLEPSTSTEDIINNFTDKIPGMDCEKINTKYPESYSSFKITVNSQNYSEAVNPKNWPIGVLVKKFFRGKSTKSGDPSST